MTEKTTRADEGMTATMFAYLNGDLQADERSRFEAMLAVRSDARAELDDWRELRGELELRKQERAPEAGLDAFTRRMREFSPRRKAGIAEWLERWMRTLYSPPRYAAALLLVVVQAGFLAALLVNSPADEHAGDASTTQVRSINGATAVSLRARFKPGATAREIAATLSNAGARIADGPGQGGFYTLRVPDKSRDAAITALRNSTVIDELIEGPNTPTPGTGKVPDR
ncbi:MAG: hypothetical protein IPJ21_13070 [Sterolibacteriaceae bacterium]|nr:hypothetical protein [Sterolibacteriaceae bacterium]MBK9084725.1 hypothetical protein [Sterolibacteriaceae bacterium]